MALHRPGGFARDPAMASADVAEDEHLIPSHSNADSLRQRILSGFRDTSRPLRGFLLYSWAIEVYAVVCLTLFLRAPASDLCGEIQLMPRLHARSHRIGAVRTRCRKTGFRPHPAVHRGNSHLRGANTGDVDKVRLHPDSMSILPF